MDRVARLVVTALVLFWVIALARTCGFVGEPPTTTNVTATPAVTATFRPTHTPAPTPTATPIMAVHVVQSGESLWSIARQYGVAVDDLILVNNLVDPSHLRVGTKLLIPPRKP